MNQSLKKKIVILFLILSIVFFVPAPRVEASWGGCAPSSLFGQFLNALERYGPTVFIVAVVTVATLGSGTAPTLGLTAAQAAGAAGAAAGAGAAATITGGTVAIAAATAAGAGVATGIGTAGGTVSAAVTGIEIATLAGTPAGASVISAATTAGIGSIGVGAAGTVSIETAAALGAVSGASVGGGLTASAAGAALGASVGAQAAIGVVAGAGAATSGAVEAAAAAIGSASGWAAGATAAAAASGGLPAAIAAGGAAGAMAGSAAAASAAMSGAIGADLGLAAIGASAGASAGAIAGASAASISAAEAAWTASYVAALGGGSVATATVSATIPVMTSAAVATATGASTLAAGVSAGTVATIGAISAAGTVACSSGLTCQNYTTSTGTPVVVVAPKNPATCGYRLSPKFYIPQMNVNYGIFDNQMSFIYTTPPDPEDGSTSDLEVLIQTDHRYLDSRCITQSDTGTYGLVDRYVSRNSPPPGCHKLSIYSGSACTQDQNFNETNSQIAIYRFTLPISSSDERYRQWLFQDISSQVGRGFADVVNGKYYSSWINPYAADNGCGDGGFNSTQGAPIDSGEPILRFVGPASSLICSGTDCQKFCTGNVCTFNDTDVPDNSYVAYVAKVLGDYISPTYTGSGVTTSVTYDEDANEVTRTYIDGGAPYGMNFERIGTCGIYGSGKFLNSDDSSKSEFIVGGNTYNGLGNAIIGPFKTEVAAESPGCIENGVCGSAGVDTSLAPRMLNQVQSTGSAGSAPTTNLCEKGTPSAVSGSGPWSWSCAGSNGGSTANCQAGEICTPPKTIVNGVCVLATTHDGACGSQFVGVGKSYPLSATGYGSDLQCASGKSSNTTFPAPGNIVTWECTSTDGGATSNQCLASRKSDPSCTNLPLNANYFAPPDNTLDSTSPDISYTYSAVGDTAKKCEFNCNSGYTYNSTTKTCNNNEVMTGTLNVTDCTISAGDDSCDVTLSWDTFNPVGISAVTTSPNITVAKANQSAGMHYSVKYGSRTFYLYNSGMELNAPGGVVASANCASSTVWNGDKCAPVIPGGWSDWAPPKSNACGYSGTQTRTCTKPIPENGGLGCSDPRNPNYDGGNSERPYTNPPCPIDGKCSSPAVHYECSVGNSVNNINSPSRWAWTCAGLYGGNSSAQCFEKKGPGYIEN